MAVDASGNLVADADGRSVDRTGMLRDKVRSQGQAAGQSDAQVIGYTCDALRTHAVESVIKGGYAVPLPALKAIRREIWGEAFDAGWSACEEAVEISDAGNATS